MSLLWGLYGFYDSLVIVTYVSILRSLILYRPSFSSGSELSKLAAVTSLGLFHMEIAFRLNQSSSTRFLALRSILRSLNQFLHRTIQNLHQALNLGNS